MHALTPQFHRKEGKKMQQMPLIFGTSAKDSYLNIAGVEKQCFTRHLTLCLSNTDYAALVSEYYIRNRNLLAGTKQDDAYYSALHQTLLLSNDEMDYWQMSGLRYWVRKRGSENFIGSVALTNICWGPSSSASIAYRMEGIPSARGYALEAATKIIDIAFNTLYLRRLDAIVTPKNHRALHNLHTFGFDEVGLLKSHLRINNTWEDHILLTLLNPYFL